MNRINVLIATITMASMSAAASIADAQTTGPKSRAAECRDTEAAWQRESTNLPSASPPVDRTTKAADPIPKATTKAEKRARFAAEERALQQASTNMPPSAPVDRSALPADPVPKARTPAEKRARFIQEEATLQRETP